MMNKIARKIKLYSTNPFRPVKESPIIFDRNTGYLFINPNSGYAGHSKIYDMIHEKGPLEDPYGMDEAHGYWYPQGDNYRGGGHSHFYWSNGEPDEVEQTQIETALNALTQDRKLPNVY